MPLNAELGTDAHIQLFHLDFLWICTSEVPHARDATFLPGLWVLQFKGTMLRACFHSWYKQSWLGCFLNAWAWDKDLYRSSLFGWCTREQGWGTGQSEDEKGGLGRISLHYQSHYWAQLGLIPPRSFCGLHRMPLRVLYLGVNWREQLSSRSLLRWLWLNPGHLLPWTFIWSLGSQTMELQRKGTFPPFS